MSTSSEKELDYLFIGDSFFASNHLAARIRKNYRSVYDQDITIDSSFVNGRNCIMQIMRDEVLRTKLKNHPYKNIVLQSPSLLEPGIEDDLLLAIDEISKLCPSVEHVILIPLNECTFFPKYECKEIKKEIECNIFQNCLEELDTIAIVSQRLSSIIKNLEVLPFSHLKKAMIDISFKKADDIHGHPSKEMQEVLARSFVIWILNQNLKPLDIHKYSNLTDSYLTLSQEEMEHTMSKFINLLNIEH